MQESSSKNIIINKKRFYGSFYQTSPALILDSFKEIKKQNKVKKKCKSGVKQGSSVAMVDK